MGNNINSFILSHNGQMVYAHHMPGSGYAPHPAPSPHTTYHPTVPSFQSPGHFSPFHQGPGKWQGLPDHRRSCLRWRPIQARTLFCRHSQPLWPLALSIAIEWGDSSALSPGVSLWSASQQCPQPAPEPLSTRACSCSVCPGDCPPHAPAAQNPYSSAQPGAGKVLMESRLLLPHTARGLGPPSLADKAGVTDSRLFCVG